MLREIDRGGPGPGGRRRHRHPYKVPLHKVATGGEVELTQHQLRCACRATLALCPYHAALRHVGRLQRRAFGPSSSFVGSSWHPDPQRTTPAQLFAGHVARVAGTTWLASKGVSTPIIQLLGPLQWDWRPTSYRGSWPRDAAEPARPQELMDLDPEEDDDGFPIILDPVNSSAVEFVAAPGQDLAARAVPADHYIDNEKQKKVHAPDPAELTEDRFLWKARGGCTTGRTASSSKVRPSLRHLMAGGAAGTLLGASGLTTPRRTRSSGPRCCPGPRRCTPCHGCVPSASSPELPRCRGTRRERSLGHEVAPLRDWGRRDQAGGPTGATTVRTKAGDK